MNDGDVLDVTLTHVGPSGRHTPDRCSPGLHLDSPKPESIKQPRRDKAEKFASSAEASLFPLLDRFLGA